MPRRLASETNGRSPSASSVRSVSLSKSSTSGAARKTSAESTGKLVLALAIAVFGLSESTYATSVSLREFTHQTFFAR